MSAPCAVEMAMQLIRAASVAVMTEAIFMLPVAVDNGVKQMSVGKDSEGAENG